MFPPTTQELLVANLEGAKIAGGSCNPILS